MFVWHYSETKMVLPTEAGLQKGPSLLHHTEYLVGSQTVSLRPFSLPSSVEWPSLQSSFLRTQLKCPLSDKAFPNCRQHKRTETTLEFHGFVGKSITWAPIAVALQDPSI